MSGLIVDGISVRYGESMVLDDFSVDIGEGQILAVVGPSGSGKSTMLRAIAGLEPLVGGRIMLDGRDLAGVPTHRRQLGLMFQDHGLFPHLNVADNIAYGLRMQGVGGSTQQDRVDELLELVGLADFGSRRTHQLSGGEAQRVALARALAPKPDLLMLDEPLGSLDRSLRHQLTDDLRRLLTELGQTAVHVTHDQAEAFALADRVAVVDDGTVAAVGDPHELWTNPVNRFVAEFLGHENIWPLVVDDQMSAHWDGQPLGELGVGPLRLAGPGPCTVVVPVTSLTVKPESRPESRPEHSEDHYLGATVSEVVFQQGVHLVTAAADHHGKIIRCRSTERLAVGDRVAIFVDTAAMRPIVD